MARIMGIGGDLPEVEVKATRIKKTGITDFIPIIIGATLGVGSFYVDGTLKWALRAAAATPFLFKAMKNPNDTPNPETANPNKPINSTKYNDLRAEYIRLYDSMIIDPGKLKQVDNVIDKIVKNKSRYQLVTYGTSIPWYLVGFKHFLEGGLKFSTHLHNGDPLSARTVNVPAGRPLKGSPPYTWEESAVDALMNVAQLHLVKDWSLPMILWRAEKYNGMGYRKKSISIFTPYLWSFSNHYKKGKYVKDGIYDPNAVSKQIGFAVLLKRMEQRNLITIKQTA